MAGKRHTFPDVHDVSTYLIKSNLCESYAIFSYLVVTYQIINQSINWSNRIKLNIKWNQPSTNQPLGAIEPINQPIHPSIYPSTYPPTITYLYHISLALSMNQKTSFASWIPRNVLAWCISAASRSQHPIWVGLSRYPNLAGGLFFMENSQSKLDD